MSSQPKLYFLHESTTDFVIPLGPILLAIGLLGLLVLLLRLSAKRRPPVRKS
jgi:cell division protein FtsW (lipid II flippase)